MVIRYAFGTLAVLMMLSGPAGAQTSPVVVPEGVAVAVPARGAPALPRTAVPQPRPRPARLSPPPAEPASTVPPAVALVPLAAAVAATLSGGGGGSGISAPTRTR
jgi:hypothetical protein